MVIAIMKVSVTEIEKHFIKISSPESHDFRYVSIPADLIIYTLQLLMALCYMSKWYGLNSIKVWSDQNFNDERCEEYLLVIANQISSTCPLQSLVWLYFDLQK